MTHKPAASAKVEGAALVSVRAVAATLCACALTASLRAATVTVTSSTDAVNGDVSTPEMLLASPGNDGISLREAIEAANRTEGPHLIDFVPALRGAKIELTDTLPPITREEITLVGFVDGEGSPAVTLDASRVIAPTDQGILFIKASRTTVRRLRFRQTPQIVWAAIVIDPDRPATSVTSILIEENDFDNSDYRPVAGSGPHGLRFSTGPGGPPGQAIAYPHCLLADITIRRNTFSGFTGDADAILGAPSGESSRLESLLIEENTFYNCTFGVEVGGHTGPGVLVRNVTIRNNRFDTVSLPLPIGIGGANNRFEGLFITGNSMTTGPQGVHVGPVDGPDTTMRHVVVASNRFEGVQSPIRLAPRGQDNSIREIEIVANTFHEVGSSLDVENLGKGTVISDLLVAEHVFPMHVHIAGYGDQAIIERVTIERNRFDGTDAVLAINGGDAGTGNVTRNVKIRDNVSTKYVSLNGGILASMGGRLEDVEVINNTFVVSDGPALIVRDNAEGAVGNAALNVRLINNILWSIDTDLEGKLQSTDVFYTRTSTPGFAGLNGNIADDPLFVQPGSDFRLRVGSRAIDSGDPENCTEKDIRGVRRAVDGDRDGVARCDLGAFEFVDSTRRRAVRH